MRRLAFGRPRVGAPIEEWKRWVEKCLQAVQNASYQPEGEVAQGYEVTPPATLLRAIDPATITDQELKDLVATLVYDLKSRGGFNT